VPRQAATVSILGKPFIRIPADRLPQRSVPYSLHMNRFYLRLIGAIALIGLSTPAAMDGQSSGKPAAPQQAPAGAAAAPDSAATQPQFYDEPHFTVAGVTDATTMGGHGSSPAIIRNAESMVRATAALTNPPSTKPPSIENSAATEASLRQAFQHRPDSFEANSELGKWLADEERPTEAIVYLERASGINPGDFENLHALSLAYFKLANYTYAKTQAGPLLSAAADDRQKAEVHRLLAEIDEKLGDPLEAVRELQRAAELNPSEANLFDWGTELLLHRAAEPAIEVFTKGNHLFPRSVRMLTALGASLYVLGSPDKAAQRLCAASDLNSEDPNPYLFMGKMQSTEAIPPEAITVALARFAKLHPENALANYYYAVSLWRARKSAAADASPPVQIESLLTKAVKLDPRLGEAYLQLGIVYAEQKKTDEAISVYVRAISASPELSEAHYRLAQAYRQSGEAEKAQAELQLYEKISKNANETDVQRGQTQQFVYQLQQAKPSSQPE
jgi:tetratricopeptide (TPR) repeat protein